MALAAFGRTGKIAAIDGFCSTVRHEFVEALPRYLSGPEPWVELNTRPESSSGTALASVYSEGLRITWVVLEISSPDDQWHETTHYFFDESGRIVKQERFLEHIPANVQIEEIRYFQNGRQIKRTFRHKALAKGRENWDEIDDPHAPAYTKTADLPAAFQPSDLKQIARASF